jgi:hypothetical protein
MSLLLTMNIAIQKRETFDFFIDLDIDVKTLFVNCFDRNLGFELDPITSKRISMTPEITTIFFRLLYLTWQQMYYEESKDVFESDDFFDDSHDYATCDKFMPDSKQRCSNDEIYDFISDVIKKGVFVASAYGFKNVFSGCVSGFVDLSQRGGSDDFCTKGTQVLSAKVMQYLNVLPFPPFLGQDNVFKHDESDVIYGFDVGYELSPLERNRSLLVNGFSSKKWMHDSLCARKDSTRQPFADLNGK